MSYLQLADNGSNILDSYVHVPGHLTTSGTTQYVREDFFDDLPEYQYQVVMNELEPFQLSDEGILLQDKASRQKRREDRRALKSRGKEAKIKKREARAEYKTKQAEGEEGFEKGKGFKAVLDTVGGIFGGGQTRVQGGLEIENGDFGYNLKTTTDTGQWIKGIPNWAVIGGGALVLVGGFLLLRKKK